VRPNRVEVSAEVADWLIDLARDDREAAMSALAAIIHVEQSPVPEKFGNLYAIVHAGYFVLYALIENDIAYVTACRRVSRQYPTRL
jgi:hypothetical protein